MSPEMRKLDNWLNEHGWKIALTIMAFGIATSDWLVGAIWAVVLILQLVARRRKHQAEKRYRQW